MTKGIIKIQAITRGKHIDAMSGRPAEGPPLVVDENA